MNIIMNFFLKLEALQGAETVGATREAASAASAAAATASGVVGVPAGDSASARSRAAVSLPILPASAF